MGILDMAKKAAEGNIMDAVGDLIPDSLKPNEQAAEEQAAEEQPASASGLIPQELEALIKECLSDGVLTDKERQVIMRKAERMDLDLDEIEVYLDAQVQKIEQAQAAEERRTKHGEVKKCPQCGEPVEAMAVRCSACGYEFRNVEALKSSQQLADKLDEVDKAYRDKGMGFMNRKLMQIFTEKKLSSKTSQFLLPKRI